MIIWLLAGMGLYLANVYLAGVLLFAVAGPRVYMGPRDSLPEDSVLRGRALKASANFAESLPIFLGLGVLSFVVPEADQQLALVGAQMFVLSRLAYIAVYVAGVPFIRSIVFTVGLVGLGAMALALV